MRSVGALSLEERAMPLISPEEVKVKVKYDSLLRPS
jgi:hypothetical protein